MASAILSKVDGLGASIAAKGKGLLDSFFPPEKRAELLARIKAFVLKNPKISVCTAQLPVVMTWTDRCRLSS